MSAQSQEERKIPGAAALSGHVLVTKGLGPLPNTPLLPAVCCTALSLALGRQRGKQSSVSLRPFCSAWGVLDYPELPNKILSIKAKRWSEL